MKKQLKYFMAAIAIIILSTPLGRITVRTIYYNANLANEYTSILNGFIHSFMLIGALIFIKGLVNTVINDKRSKL
ncbi:hypothetical protein SAMN05660297_03458 [Natronincola peptidivorans]|uniref:Glycosyl transferase n=1 Tax=Natronincola peptidivorans TaxID=426128 RepID=A0A1I0H3Q7_9FIRM|nr:glycosyl transferase [Natronincola peptidivorans]SET77440.1 hypothetical protein SAMN05660297_03458 [Natronincola peptidivorans]